MTTDNEPLPAAWEAALERFRGGYGCEFDPTDATDRFCFMQLLEEAVHDRITRDLVASFRRATEKMKAATRALDEQRR